MKDVPADCRDTQPGSRWSSSAPSSRWKVPNFIYLTSRWLIDFVNHDNGATSPLFCFFQYETSSVAWFSFRKHLPAKARNTQQPLWHASIPPPKSPACVPGVAHDVNTAPVGTAIFSARGWWFHAFFQYRWVHCTLSYSYASRARLLSTLSTRLLSSVVGDERDITDVFLLPTSISSVIFSKFIF